MKATQRKTPCASWRAIMAGLLMTTLAGCASTGGERPPNLTGTTWQWVETVAADDGKHTIIPTPEKFNLVFREDGTYAGLADCNVIGGRYAWEDGFQIQPGMSTRAFCGETSLDQTFLNLLEQVASAKGDEDDRLILEAKDGTKMIFRNGGSAP